MNPEKYLYHMSLLPYREEGMKTRLAALRADMHQPKNTLCGFAELLQIHMNKAQSVPNSLFDFQATVKSICVTLTELREKTDYDREILTEETAKEALLLFWQKYEVVQIALSLPTKMQALEADFRNVMPRFEFWLENITDKTLLLWAEFDVLANPNTMDLPDEYVQFYELLEESLEEIRVGNFIGLEQVIAASRHELSYFRNIATTVLGHFKDERATDALILLLFDEVEEIRGWAASSLKNTNNEKVISALVQALQQNFNDEAYIGWIGDALAEMPNELAVDALVVTLDSIMTDPTRSHGFFTYPVAGLYKALKAIGGEKAEAAIKRHFGS
jgi:hypothetical protein